MTTAQRDRAIQIAIGRDLIRAHVLVANLVNYPEAACPQIGREGTTRTLTFGCRARGYDLAGRIVSTNERPPGGPAPTEPSEVRYQGFTAIGGDPSFAPDLALDGLLGADGHAIYTSDLADMPIKVDARWTRGPVLGDDESATAGSLLDIPGIGTAEIMGVWSATPFRGTIELHGRDVLVVHLDEVGDDFCAPVTIDGAPAGTHCWP